MPGPQLHVHHGGLHALAGERVAAITNRYVKPSGGLWTSTYDERHGSGWVQWCLDEEYSLPKAGLWQCTLLHPSPTARVYEIDTLADLKRLLRTFGENTLGAGLRFGYPDFEAVAREFDAIHLTDAGQWATRYSEPSLYGWDCESTLWLRWVFASVEEIGLRTFEPIREPAEAVA